MGTNMASRLARDRKPGRGREGAVRSSPRPLVGPLEDFRETRMQANVLAFSPLLRPSRVAAGASGPEPTFRSGSMRLENALASAPRAADKSAERSGFALNTLTSMPRLSRYPGQLY